MSKKQKSPYRELAMSKTKPRGKTILRNVIVISFRNKRLLGTAFFRVQEFYEGRGVVGKVVPIGHLISYYTENGVFMYTLDNEGYNVPGNIVELFKQKHTLYPLEQTLFDLIDSLKISSKFYVIGVFGTKTVNRNAIVNHEIAHALYYLSSKYRREVKQILEKVDLSGVFATLRSMGYSKKVYYDEANAYLTTGAAPIESYGADIAHLKDTIKKLKKAFRWITREYKKDQIGT